MPQIHPCDFGKGVVFGPRRGTEAVVENKKISRRRKVAAGFIAGSIAFFERLERSNLLGNEPA